jgi:hypothetical protein
MKLNNDNRFDIDLEYGQIFEQKIANIFQSSKIEVKTERDKWNSTGNIVIEFESRGHPSGIAVTQADFWFHNLALKGELIMTLVFPVAVLKRYIKQNNPRVVRGGDDNTSKLYLINLADLVTIIE